MRLGEVQVVAATEYPVQLHGVEHPHVVSRNAVKFETLLQVARRKLSVDEKKPTRTLHGPMKPRLPGAECLRHRGTHLCFPDARRPVDNDNVMVRNRSDEKLSLRVGSLQEFIRRGQLW